MNEPLREMISAVVDGEASDFEYRRVLDSLQDADVQGLLGRHYIARSVLRAEAHALCPPALTSSILAALAAEADVPVSVAASRWRVPLGGVAVAASVCMVAVIGLRALAPGYDEGAAAPLVAASGSSALGQLGRPASAPVHVAGPAVPVGFGAVSAVPGAGAQPAGMDPDQLAEERLRLFMVDHVQNAALHTNQGMLPYARVVGYEAP